MSANIYTTSRLIDDIKLMGHVPISQNTFDEEKLLRLATLEIQTPIAAQILSTRGGYYLGYLDIPPDAANDGIYQIPAGSVCGAIMNIELVVNSSIIPVNIIEESEQLSTISPTSTSYGAFLRGNYFQILPIPPVGMCRVWFTKRTSDLIQTIHAAQVTGIASNVISVSSVPDTIAVNSLVDACGDQPPFNLLGEALTVTGISGTDITLSSAVSGLSLGDWLAPNGQTPVPQIPVEFRILTAQRVVCKIYELQGYLEKLKAAEAKLEKYEKNTFSLITPRVKNNTKIVNPINGGFLTGNVNRMTNFPAPR